MKKLYFTIILIWLLVKELCIFSLGVMYVYLIAIEFYSFLTISLLKFLSTRLEAILEGLLAGLSHDAPAVGDLPILSTPTFLPWSLRKP